MAVKISLEDLLESGAHFGHQVRRWNPKVKEFVYGEQDGVHIFDLVKTKESLEAALSEITKTVKEGKSILLLATKKQAKDKALEIGKETGISIVTERWLGGTITNFSQIKKSLDKLADMKEKLSNGYYAKYTKKERVLIEREKDRLERFFGGITNLKSTPDLLIVVDIRKEDTAIREAKRKGVEIIGIVDTNSDPNQVTFPIPMNDDATKALHLVLEYIKEAILEGKNVKKEVKEKVVKEKIKQVKKAKKSK
ncbi:MAG TPA: 30S ribosomal protein S2 [Patescibacteria group bacterium]|nr:30S ribosomal protein S2 [Patescibacteria group bacterium]